MVMGFAGEEEAFDEEEYLSSQGQGWGYDMGPADPYDPYSEVEEQDAYQSYSEPNYQPDPWEAPSYQEPSYPNYQAPDYSYSEPSYGGGWGSSVADEVDNSAFDEAWAQYNAPRSQDFGSAYVPQDDDDSDSGGHVNYPVYEDFTDWANQQDNALSNFLDLANTGFGIIGKTRDALQDIDRQAYERDEARTDAELEDWATGWQGLQTEDYQPNWADILRQQSGLEGADTGFVQGFPRDFGEAAWEGFSATPLFSFGNPSNPYQRPQNVSMRDVAGIDIPYSEQVQDIAGDVGARLGSQLDPFGLWDPISGALNPFGGGVSGAEAGRQLAEWQVPRELWEVPLTALDVVPAARGVAGAIPDAFQAARRVGDDALGAVQRGLDLPQTYYRGVEPSFLESTRQGGLPEGLALTPDRGVAEAYAQRYGGEVMDFRARPSQMEPDSYYFRNKEPLMPSTASSDTVRLYRGQGVGEAPPAGLPEWARENAGDWFTPDIRMARRYAGDTGSIRYVDVPRNVADATTVPGTVNENLLPKIWSSRAQPFREPSGFREAILQGETGAIRIPGRGTPPPSKLIDDAFDGIIPGPGGETIPDAAFRQYEGAVDTAARTELANIADGRRILRAAGKTPGRPDEDILNLYRALHGEGEAPEHLRPVYDDVKRLIDEEEAVTVDFDPQFELHSDYFPRFWKEPPGGDPRPKTLGARPGFTRERVSATFSELIDAGFEPRSYNPYEMAALRRMSGAEYREQTRLLEKLTQNGQVVDAIGPIPDGWRIPDVTGNVFGGKAYVDEAGQLRFTPRKMVPNSVAAPLEQLFGRKLNWGTVGNLDVHNVISQAFNAPKRAKLFGSLFQQIDFAHRTGFNAFGGAVDDLLHLRPISATSKMAKVPVNVSQLIVANLSPSRRQSLRRLLTSDTPVTKDRPGLTWKLISQQGLGTGDVTVFNSSLRDSLIEATGTGLTGRARRIANSINGAVQRGLFEGVYPQAQKMAIENHWAPSTIRAHPDWTDAQLAADIAVNANKALSSLPTSQSFRRHLNRNVTELARMLWFSTNETESFMKATLSTVKGPDKRLWAEYWAGGVIYLAVLAESIHFAVTGEPLPVDRLSPVTPGGPLGVKYNTRFMAPTVAEGLGRGGTDLTLDLVGQMDTALRVLDPASFISGRLNVLPRAAWNQYKGRDFYGKPYEGLKGRVVGLAKDLAAPISLGGPMGQDPRLGKTGGWLEASGMNLRADTNDDIRQKLAQQNWNPEWGDSKKWEDVPPLAREDIMKANPELAAELERRGEEAVERGSAAAATTAEIKRLQAERNRQQELDDAALRSGELSGEEWRELRSDRNIASGSAVRQEGTHYDDSRDISGIVAMAREKYGGFIEAATTPNGTVDWDKVDRQLAVLSPREQEVILQDRFAGSTDQERKYLAGIQQSIPYFNFTEDAWAVAQQSDPTLMQFETVDAYRKSEQKELVAEGLPPELAEKVSYALSNALIKGEVAANSVDWLLDHPAEVAFLVEYGFYVPEAIKKIAVAEQIGAR